MTAVVTATTRPDTDGAAYWNSGIGDNFTAVAATPRQSQLFAPRISIHDMGHLTLASVEAEACLLHRSAAQAAHSGDLPVHLHIQISGAGILSRDGRQELISEGDLVVCDATRPYSMAYSGRFRAHVFSLPRRALGVTDAELHRVIGTPIQPSRGVAAVLAPLLTELAESASGYPDPVAEQLGGHVTDLTATLIAERAAGVPAVEHTERRHLALRVRQYINHHLHDPHLTPEWIARAHHISVRYLHRIFEDEGTTVSRLVQQRRLAECRRELARRTPVNLTVSAVAHRWGFTNAAYFSKAFRAAFGVSPSEWRDARITAPQ